MIHGLPTPTVSEEELHRVHPPLYVCRWLWPEIQGARPIFLSEEWHILSISQALRTHPGYRGFYQYIPCIQRYGVVLFLFNLRVLIVQYASKFIFRL
jgi:hypothetical protein